MFMKSTGSRAYIHLNRTTDMSIFDIYSGINVHKSNFKAAELIFYSGSFIGISIVYNVPKSAIANEAFTIIPDTHTYIYIYVDT